MVYKTNVMRVMDKAKAQYKSHCYADTLAISGIDVANVLNQDPRQVFKTLVTLGKSGKHFVFVIPVADELDLKKAALSVKEKSVEMVKTKDLLPLTGYVHGGCSPIGMKKMYKTTLDESAAAFDTILFSAGKIGYQVEINLGELKKVIDYDLADVIKTEV